MRHRKGLGPGLNHAATNGRLLEGNIGGRGSDSGTAGGASGNPDGGTSRDSSRFNSGGGGGSDPDPFRTVRGAVSDIGGAVGSTVDTVTSPVTDAVDFVTSGPTEASVGDDDFSDPGTVDTPTTGGSPPRSSTPAPTPARVDLDAGTDKQSRRLDTVSNITNQNVTVETGERFGDQQVLDGADQFTDSLARTVGAVGTSAGNALGSGIDTVVGNQVAASPGLQSTTTAGTDDDTASTPAGQTTRGAVEGLALPAQLPAVGVEAAEAAGFAANRPGEAASRIDDAVARRALTGAEGVASDPFGASGQVATSVGLSGAAFRATRGTPAAGPTRTALQPVEEGAKAAARRGVIDPDTATTIPGVRAGQSGLPPVDSGDADPFRPDIGGDGAGSVLARNDDSTDTPTGLDRGSTPSTPTSRGRNNNRREIGSTDTTEVDPTDVFDTGDRSLVDAQASGQLGAIRSPESRSVETPGRSINDERLSPNLRQQTITRRQRELDDATESGTFEGERSPFATESERARRQRDLDRIDDASRRFDRRQRNALDAEPELTGVGGAVGVGAGAGALGDLDTFGDTGVGVGTDTDTQTDTAAREATREAELLTLRGETAVEPRRGARREANPETEVEAGGETDLGFGLESEISTEIITDEPPTPEEEDDEVAPPLFDQDDALVDSGITSGSEAFEAAFGDRDDRFML